MLLLEKNIRLYKIKEQKISFFLGYISIEKLF